MMHAKLPDAVAIFKQLGWETVTADNVLDLPLGTPEQKRAALAGLRSGEWGEVAELKENTYGWRSYVDVDAGKLALFAVRIGIDAQRAANLLHRGDNELLVKTLAQRGEKFASDFIRHACVSRYRSWEHSASVFGSAAVLLVDRLALDIPQTVEYMKDWSVYAAAAMGLKAETLHGETDFPGLELIEKRFAEHIQTGVAVGVAATGPFGEVFPEGVKRGWIPRGQGLEWAFLALDAAARPGDRKIWLRVLDALSVTDAELGERIQSLIPLLATGDTAVVTRLAPTLITKAKDGLLTEVLLAAFSATTNKARRMALKAALGRPRPENAENLAVLLNVLANDTDKAVSVPAGRLMRQWSVSADALPEEAADVQGLWRETPPLWLMPSFEIGEISPEALTALAAQLVNQAAMVHDVTAERFLAMANAVARENPEAARRSLRGLSSYGNWLPYFAGCWAKNEEPLYGFDKDGKSNQLQALVQNPLTARDYTVFLHLGELPALLSMPSGVDLSIRVPDLLARLAMYQKGGAEALEADLFLALTRLDVTTATAEARRALEKLDVPIRLQTGKKMPVTAGQAVLAYVDDPVREPPLQLDKGGYWDGIPAPESLRNFPARLSAHLPERFSVFPCLGDAVLRDVHWNSSEVYHEKGLILRQVARRRNPLPPGASVNLLAAQRSSDPDAAEDSLLSVREAWERGLLRPGSADVLLLDWSAKPPSSLAALAAALEGIARDGLLSVVWPLLDALIDLSLNAPRLLAGTAELAELAANLLPEVQSAVEQGKAEKSALYVPGLRALADRSGSSRAVSAARKAVNALPPVEACATAKRPAAPVMDPPFDEVWPANRKEVVLIEDGVTVTVDAASSKDPKRMLLFTLTLPDVSERAFQVVKSWYYDLESEGQCEAFVAPPGTVTFDGTKQPQVWLHWDTEKKAMAVSKRRNWRRGTDDPLATGAARPPLPLSLLTVIIGLLAQDGDAIYFAPQLLKKFIENGQIDAHVVRRAAQTLLQSPAVSPAKLARVLEKESRLLPALWPMLTESVKAAGSLAASGGKPPVWVNRVLDIALRCAPYLAEAARRGFIPPETARWVGLSEIAASKVKGAAVIKAQDLLPRLALQPVIGL